MSKYIRTNLAQLRFANGKLTQREVSEGTGIGQKTLSALETGASKGIEFRTLLKLTDYFKCSIDDILVVEEEVEDKPPSEESLKKADDLIARGIKKAIDTPQQTPAEIWAEFDELRSKLQRERIDRRQKTTSA